MYSDWLATRNDLVALVGPRGLGLQAQRQDVQSSAHRFEDIGAARNGGRRELFGGVNREVLGVKNVSVVPRRIPI